MDTYQDIISRLGAYLADIEADVHKPLADAANKYRLTAEVICKAIIVGHKGEPQGLLEKLIADALKWIEAEETSRDAGLFKSEIKYLQNVGNAYSHDGAASALARNEDQSAAFDALVKTIRVAFFGQGDLDAPVLPKLIEGRIPARTLGRGTFENPRAEEVVRLCYPKHKIENKLSRSDRVNRLVYDYVVVDLGGLTKGMLFIRSKTAIEKTLVDFNAAIGLDFPDALEIITPRAYRPDGGEIDRRKSITDIIKDLSFDSRGRKVSVKYFDDFVWESCLPQKFRDDKAPIKRASNFIEQTLEPINESGISSGTYSSTSQYIEKILRNTHDYNPVHIVIGPAGIGKTTFSDDISSYINAQDRKRVILFSATDFRDLSNSASVNSVSDLYQVAAENELMDEDSLIESHNFEINLACGNFILIIDGFDEIESHLGSSLNFDEFMRSLSDLEACFRKVLVILTVRDYDIERFRRFRQTSICRLRGFTGDDTDRYLSGRLPHGSIPEANVLLRAFNEAGNVEKPTTIPLYASLICDYLLESAATSDSSSVVTSESAKFFENGKPLDTLVRKIVDREIAKQSLGRIGPDDFFEILIEIIRAPQHTLTRAALVDYVSACDGDSQSIDPANFLRNIFLRWEKDTISFKYDSLTYFFKSRLLSRKVKEGQFSPSPSIEFMAEFYRGEGPLYDELKAIFPAANFRTSAGTLKWFESLMQYGRREPESKLPWRKAMSAFLYWALDNSVDKFDRSSNLKTYFGGDVLNGFSIYDRFYPLDLTGVSVYDGHIENFSNLNNCDYLPGKAVFHSSQINFDDRFLPEKLDRSLFAEDCVFSPNLATSFQAKDLADETSHEIIRDNVYKILKVGFRGNRFYWKSRDVYKNVMVVGKHSLDAYLAFLAEQGVLMLEHSRTGGEPGYVVSDGWYTDARKLVEERNLTSRMYALVSNLPKSIQ
ncbi:NACHT domain-containing protein [Paraburkholderia unamae]|uniref:NACHT domain-containing protein n=1 Tax=Paraburkholderia unamae TaxID=219649 RepID=A0ABX5KUB3_9BURK|nr:NACHT domain-containing protein [Paraburkholderia unamae]PVX85849.1 NACHT domain-containing protein [Paraburkholderia unamae]